MSPSAPHPSVYPTSLSFWPQHVDRRGHSHLQDSQATVTITVTVIPTDRYRDPSETSWLSYYPILSGEAPSPYPTSPPVHDWALSASERPTAAVELRPDSSAAKLNSIIVGVVCVGVVLTIILLVIVFVMIRHYRRQLQVLYESRSCDGKPPRAPSILMTRVAHRT